MVLTYKLSHINNPSTNININISIYIHMIELASVHILAMGCTWIWIQIIIIHSLILPKNTGCCTSCSSRWLGSQAQLFVVIVRGLWSTDHSPSSRIMRLPYWIRLCRSDIIIGCWLTSCNLKPVSSTTVWLSPDVSHRSTGRHWRSAWRSTCPPIWPSSTPFSTTS